MFPTTSRGDAAFRHGGRPNQRVAVSDDCCIPTSVFRYVARVLRDLGYRTRMNVVSDSALNRRLERSEHDVPLIPITWFGGELGSG
jgi:hypothetical protein